LKPLCPSQRKQKSKIKVVGHFFKRRICAVAKNEYIEDLTFIFDFCGLSLHNGFE